MTNSGMRGAIVAVLLASFATLPAAANAATVSTTTSCVDVQSTTDQFVDITATGLDPSGSYYPLLELSPGADDFEVGSPVDGVLTPDAAGNGTGSVWFDQGTYAATSATAGDGQSVWLKLRDLNNGYSVAAEIRVPACGSDVTPPLLNLPADVTTDATSASGAPVSYTAAATDDVDGSVPVTCNPASGSTFAVGTTTVTCSAKDAAGNAAQSTFTVTVRAQAEQAGPSLEDLLAQLRADVLRGRSPKNACNTLNVIENQIRARTGKSIAPRQADQYLAVARLVGTLLRCR